MFIVGLFGCGVSRISTLFVEEDDKVRAYGWGYLEVGLFRTT